jgi:transcriptional regulator with PAS, ATPase and Fis domain
MDKHAWYKVFPGAITVTDEKGTVIEMNDASARMFNKDGGYEVMGRNAITCHPERTQPKVRKLYETASANIYSITKNGKKQLVYQVPYFIEGNFSGIVELCLDLPEGIPHFDRDKK